jgi:hypothetical protein
MNDRKKKLRIAPVTHFDRLMGLCARGDTHPELHALLHAAADGYTAWDSLAERSERHGIAPLVRHHLRSAGVGMPQEIARTFVGLELRHKRMNALRARLLAELCAAFEARSVKLLLLKGAGLAFRHYPSPSLRAMRDVDLLVREEDLPVVAEIMRGLHYAAEDEAGWVAHERHHHLPARTRVVDGATITIEVHRRLGIEDARIPRTLDALWERAASFEIEGQRAHTLGATDMLVHVYHHGFTTRLAWPDRCRLVSIADIVTLVDAAHAEIAWPQLARERPRMLSALGYTQLVTPWSEAARVAAGVPPMAAIDDLGLDYTGWPRERIRERKEDLRGLLHDTLAPPELWLRLRHGGDPSTAGHLRARLRHFVEVVAERAFLS